MASSSIQKATSSSYSPPQWMYDVFLSFRGKDTRNNFTSHLYSNLVQRGIDVYMDDRELERGKTIEPALWQAIEDSRFSIVVFSRDYASSPWCLDELVKIVQCMKEMGHTVLPVFYDVDPSEVADQKGNYMKASIEHKEKLSGNLDKVKCWSDCLSTVANLSGWDVRNRDESQSIKKIAEYIQCKLSFTLPTISKNLVGIDSRLKVLNEYIDEQANDTLFIGICGMGGMGKTTVARVMYDRIRWQFQGSCFLANVREVFAEKDGLCRLQEQLLSEISMELPTARDSSRRIDLIKRRLRRKRVLLILDDVDDEEQLQTLAAEHGSFGPGSRIIITSRNKHVLDSHGVTRIYEAEKLNDKDALMLFSWKAFKRDQPTEDLSELSKQVVGYANGLPLALEVIGSFLHKRGLREWKSAIDRMNDIPDRKIIDVLRISFDGLHELEKKIFLDIACFLKGMKKDRITRLLDSCGFHADIGMEALIEKSLISVSRDEIRMHNLLQKMGEEIVRLESPEEPGRRSRLCTYKDVCDALKDSTGKIESIFLDLPKAKEAPWNMTAFSKMTKLRLLKIHNVDLSEGPEYLSNELRFLEWHAYPSMSLPACFRPDELVELYMSCSSIEQLWYGCKGSSPRPGFGIVVPGNEIPGWFTHQSKESSIKVQVPSYYLDGDANGWMGFAACVAFSAHGRSPLFCHFKVDGKENYPAPMYIGCNSMQALSDHLWLFYLSFDYLKELKERENEAYSELELSFHSYERGEKVKNCGVRLVNYPYTPSWESPTGHLIVASKEAASSYIDSLANSSSYYQWMHDVFFSFSGEHTSNNFTHLYPALVQRGIIQEDRELEYLRVIESSLLRDIKESGLSIIIFARDYACSPWWCEELVKIVGFMKKMKSDTVFPVSTVSYNVEQSKVDAQAESYTIVFEKDEEDFGEDMEKVRRWMDILTEVAISFGSESSKRVNGMDWPFWNRFQGTDLEFVLHFMKKVLEERNDLDFEFDITLEEN